MKILYYSKGDGVTAIVKAMRHMGHFAPGREPFPNEVDASLKALCLPKVNDGSWVILGKDDSGNEVYACGTGQSKGILERAWANFIDLTGDSMAGWKWVDVDRLFTEVDCD